MSHIAEALQNLAVPLDDLQPHPRNPRKGDIDAIAGSLERFGQVRPIVATPGGTILAGHHVYYAAQKLGWTEIAVVQPNLSDEEAEAYLIADNRLAELGGYDDALMAQLLQDLMESGSLEGTGYDPDAVDDLLAKIGAEVVTDTEEFKGGYIEDPDATAARWQKGGDDDAPPPQPMREVVLMLKPDAFEEFARNIATLKKAYDTDSIAVTVSRACAEEAERVAAGSAA